MSVDEVKKKREDLASAIGALIDEFERDTGMKVGSMDNSYIQSVDGPRYCRPCIEVVL